MDLRPTQQQDAQVAPPDDTLTVRELDALHGDITSRLEVAGFVVEDDGWFSSGADEAHQAHLDDMGHVDEDVMEAGR